MARRLPLGEKFAGAFADEHSFAKGSLAEPKILFTFTGTIPIENDGFVHISDRSRGCKV